MEENIKKKTKIGIIWNTFERFSVQIVSFIIGIILARLLTPEDYGTVGLLTVFLSISNVFIDSGFSKGLIQKNDRTDEDFSTTLIFNFFISIILYVILFLSAPLIANFYKRPELVSLSRVLFLVIILMSLTVVQIAILQIKVDFRKIAIINFSSTLIAGIIGIIVAYKGLGVWALVIQTLVKQTMATILYWFYGHWIPKTGFYLSSFKRLFKYGSNLLITGIIATIISSINNLVIGKLYTPKILGYYSRAEQFPQLTSGTLTSVLQTTTFPLLANYQESKEELLDIFKRVVHITCLLVFPSMVGLALCSKTLIIVLLTEKWVIAAEYLFWLALSYIFSPIQILNLNLLNAIGRSDLNLKLDLIKCPFIIVCMAITLPISIKAVVIGRLIFCFIYFYIDCFVVGKMFKFGAFRQLFASWKAIVSTCVMSLILFLINNFYTNETVMKLIFMIVTGIIVYFLCLLILHEKELGILYNKLNAIRRKTN
ncbi:MAG: lipopolysaccharide biosynthesis protein [Treponema sp.]|nr:lipopolysaccharide biosynthesis protein [Treponema sp.]